MSLDFDVGVILRMTKISERIQSNKSDIEQCIDTEVIPQHIKLRRTTLELEKNLKTKRNTLNLHTKTVKIENENKSTDNGDLDFSSKEKLINFLSIVSDACKQIEPNTYADSNSIWPLVGSEEFESFAVTGTQEKNELVDDQESKSVSYSIEMIILKSKMKAQMSLMITQE